jgi:transcriptional regulator with XRE-family HTH domain
MGTKLTENLIKERKERNLTQQEVAKALNCTQTCYNRYEKGERDKNIYDLIKLCDYYKCSLDYITGRYTDNH